MQDGQITPQYLRRKQAAVYLGVSERTLATWMKTHTIPFSRVSRGVVLFKVSELEEAIRRYRVRAHGEELR